MAKKAKSEVSAVQAISVPAPTHAEAKPTPNTAGGVFAALNKLKAAGSGAAATKKAKTSVVQVKLDQPLLVEAARNFIKEKAKEKAAKSRSEGPGDMLRSWADEKWISLCRTEKQFMKTISLDGDINFGSGKVVMGKPASDKTDSKGRTLSEETINMGLTEIFGAKYADYFSPTLEIKVAPEHATEATITMLVEKLGLDHFQRIFPTFRLVTELKKDGPGDDAVVLLKKEAAMDKNVSDQLDRASKEGYISKWSGSLTVQDGALAAVQEELLQDEMTLQKTRSSQMQQVAAAAAAGAVAGANQKAG